MKKSGQRVSIVHFLSISIFCELMGPKMPTVSLVCYMKGNCLLLVFLVMCALFRQIDFAKKKNFIHIL